MEIAEAISTFGAIVELAKKAVSSKDGAKLEEALFDLKVKYLASIEKTLLLHGEIAALKGDNAAIQHKLLVSKQLLLDTQAELDELKNNLAERKSYALYEIESGVFCYRYQPMTGDEQAPPHYLCQPCWDAGKKIILRKRTDMLYVCSEFREHSLGLVSPHAA